VDKRNARYLKRGVCWWRYLAVEERGPNEKGNKRTKPKNGGSRSETRPVSIAFQTGWIKIGNWRMERKRLLREGEGKKFLSQSLGKAGC